jgi:hypothetical protein
MDKLQLWWESVSLLDPLNWAAIAVVLFCFQAVRHTKTYGLPTLPNKEEVADIFLSVGTIYGAFNIIYVIWKRLPFAEAKSGIFYLLAALMGTVVEKSAKLPLGLSIAPTKPPRKKGTPSLPPPKPPSIEPGGSSGG